MVDRREEERTDPGGEGVELYAPTHAYAWRVAGNPNVTPDNPMGVVGWDGPPDDVPSVSGDAGPLAPGSIVNAPFEGYGFGLY